MKDTNNVVRVACVTMDSWKNEVLILENHKKDKDDNKNPKCQSYNFLDWFDLSNPKTDQLSIKFVIFLWLAI